MSLYRRASARGAVFFFIVNLADRRSQQLTQHIDAFRAAYRALARDLPFETMAICILPDHLHALWRLPSGDADFSRRWQRIKANFSRSFPANLERSQSKRRQREKGIWQRRFWEHQIRNDIDLQRHVDYIHYNL